MHSDYQNITDSFKDFYFPKKALLMYQHILDEQKIYLESYDCNKKGKLVNAHPLTVKEIQSLGNVLQQYIKETQKYLHCKGLLPDNLLYLNPETKCVIWYTKPQKTHLYFTKTQQLPDAKMPLPSLIWKATDCELALYAITGNTKPVLETDLCHAPFFNIYKNGRVCMGTVDIDMGNCTDCKAFTYQWEQYFFNSHFSHTLDNYKICRSPLHELYKHLLNTKQSFPEKELIKTGKTLQNIIP